MNAFVFRLRLQDHTTWIVSSIRPSLDRAIEEAREKGSRYFPHERVRVEAWSTGGAWHEIADCASCPEADVMQSLGCACAVSCGC